MTTIGPQTHVDGRVEGDEDVTIEGRVVGSIALSETLTVAEAGRVEGDVDVRIAVIRGSLKGAITVSELLHLTETARVEANISAAVLKMDDGAQLSGEVDMTADSRAARPARTTPSSTTSTSASTSVSAPVSSSASEKKAEKSVNSESQSTTTTVTVVEDEEPDDEDPADLEELTVKDLRDMLRDKDLQVSGTKAELIERLESIDD